MYIFAHMDSGGHFAGVRPIYQIVSHVLRKGYAGRKVYTDVVLGFS